MSDQESAEGANQSALGIKNILVPVDFSSDSKRALKFAVSLAQLVGARLHLMHVVELPSFISGFETVPIKLSEAQVIDGAKTQIEALAVRDVPPSLEVARQVRTGKPFHEIVDYAKAESVDLIVLATHGYTGLKHTLMGSTAERVVRHAHCPVLVVRE